MDVEAGRVGRPGTSDAELVARCQTGDQDAWRALVARHAPLVSGLLRGAFRFEAHDAEDAFQEVFTRAYLRLSTLRDGATVRGWLAQVTRNVALDAIRRRRPEAADGEQLDDVPDLEDALGAVDRALAVRAALAALPAAQQEILERFFVRDQSYREIADELGLPPGTIASRISRALAALRQEWEREGRSPGSVPSSS